MSAELTAAEIIDRLGLEPLPLEGGQWAVSWRNDDVSAIHFLLQPGDFSAFHALTATELWHHNGGAPVQMVLLHPDGSIERPVLGIDLAAGHQPMVGVGPRVWMAAATMGEWSLVATSVSPPYEDDRFTLADRAALLASHPAASSDIEALTRPVGEEP